MTPEQHVDLLAHAALSRRRAKRWLHDRGMPSSAADLDAALEAAMADPRNLEAAKLRAAELARHLVPEPADDVPKWIIGDDENAVGTYLVRTTDPSAVVREIEPPGGGDCRMQLVCWLTPPPANPDQLRRITVQLLDEARGVMARYDEYNDARGATADEAFAIEELVDHLDLTDPQWRDSAPDGVLSVVSQIEGGDIPSPSATQEAIAWLRAAARS